MTVMPIAPSGPQFHARPAYTLGDGGSAPAVEKAPTAPAEEELSPEDKVAVAKLAAAEREVIAHERAHQSAGGAYTGSARFGYTKGPDGKDYVTSGEVSIQAPEIEMSEKGLQVVEQVKRAALAPANPSGQDMRVAAKMEAVAIRIRAELAKRRYAAPDETTSEIDMVL